MGSFLNNITGQMGPGPSGAPGGLNQLPIDMQGNVLGVGNGGLPLPDGANPQDAATDNPVYMPTLTPPGRGGMGMPGMGGKGGFGQIANPLSQIPVDMNGNVLGAEQPPMPEPSSMGGLPPAPIAAAPLAKTSGGTAGRPSPSAPMVPRGPGFANPGAPGAPPQQPMERSLLTNPQGQPQPFQGGMQNRLQPARPVPAVPSAIPRQAPAVGRPVNLTRRGAGRGGMLR